VRFFGGRFCLGHVAYFRPWQACQEYPPHHNWGSSVGFVGNAVPAAEGAEPELAVELAVEGAESAVEGAELAVVSLGRCAGAETDNKRM
jgi:hypothetical protein